MRGMGRVFQRKHSAHWWLSYYHRGREVRESSGSPDRKQAEKLLRQRLREIGADRIGAKAFIGPTQERVTVEEILQGLVTDYQVHGRKSLPTLLVHLKPVRAAFGLDRAAAVTTPRVRHVVAQWQSDGAAPATINRRLAALQRAYALAIEAGRLTSAPAAPPWRSTTRGKASSSAVSFSPSTRRSPMTISATSPSGPTGRACERARSAR